MKSSFIRTFLITSSILLGSFIILGSSITLLTYRSSIDDRIDSLEANAYVMDDMVSSFAAGNNILVSRQLQSLIYFSAQITGNHIILTNMDGGIILTSDFISPPTVLNVGDRELKEVFTKGKYSGVGTLGGLFSTSFFSVGVPIVSNTGNTVGAVFVSSSSEEINSMVRNFYGIFLSTTLIVLFVSLAWAYIAAQRMSRPMILMASAAKEFARGNFAVRVPTDSPQDDIKNLSESFNNMADELEKTEERRREFIANISHELKTPMTTIGGYVDGMLDGVIPEEKRDIYLDVVSSEVKRLSRLVSQMLELSRMESGKELELVTQSFDLCEKTRLVILGLERKINDRKLDIDVDFDKPIVVTAEPDSITRVIYNLLDNAIKYSYEGTTIKISIKIKDKKARFAVTDTGNPISPEDKAQIFERFHKTDRSRKSDGLGLGLYLVKNILMRHGEDVFCECDGSLTTIHFTLPVTN